MVSIDTHHACFERQAGVGVVVGDRALGGQARGLVADEAHAVGQKLRAVALADLGKLPLGRDVDVAAHGTGLDRGEGGALDRFDLGQAVFQLGIGIAEHRHAREIADIAVIIAAGVQRQHLALLPTLR
ncbi:hypothetical protein ACVWW2_004757 [Bradyrhizobium sp. LM4.3]